MVLVEIDENSIPLGSAVETDLVIIQTQSDGLLDWFAANSIWISLFGSLFLVLGYPLRRYLRQLRRREPWSQEKAMWAMTGQHPTKRIVRKHYKHIGGLR